MLRKLMNVFIVVIMIVIITIAIVGTLSIPNEKLEQGQMIVTVMAVNDNTITVRHGAKHRNDFTLTVADTSKYHVHDHLILTIDTCDLEPIK